jgi:hypothetical protein
MLDKLDSKSLLAGVIVILLIVGGGYYGYSQYMDSSLFNQTELDFDHSFPEHSEYFESTQYEEAPKYSEGLVAHNNKLNQSSYEFSYSREFGADSFSLDTTVNRESNKVRSLTEIHSSDFKIVRESYFSDDTEYIRSRQGTSNPDDWTYSSNGTDIDNADRTGFNELNSLEVDGVAFDYSKSVERNGTTYYVYEPEIIDEDAFKSNSWKSGERPESIDINGEVLLSEYGVVTSAKMKYTIDDVVITTSYEIKKFGPIQIEEPIWKSEASNSEEQ